MKLPIFLRSNKTSPFSVHLPSSSFIVKETLFFWNDLGTECSIFEWIFYVQRWLQTDSVIDQLTAGPLFCGYRLACVLSTTGSWHDVTSYHVIFYFSSSFSSSSFYFLFLLNRGNSCLPYFSSWVVVFAIPQTKQNQEAWQNGLLCVGRSILTMFTCFARGSTLMWTPKNVKINSNKAGIRDEISRLVSRIQP